MIKPEDIIERFNEMETTLVREEYRPMWTAAQIAEVIRNMIARDKGKSDDS